MTGTTADLADRRIAALAALAIGLQVIEAAIPSPVPGIKPGLANVVTLVALLTLGWRAALAVTLLRIVGASLLLGTLLGPAFWLSLAGGLTALAVLAVLAPLHPRTLSALGLAIPAALAHTLGQFLLAWAVIIPHPQLPLLLPPLLLAALITGLITGILTVSVLADPRIQRHVRHPSPIRTR
ncbi:Gx transporter family protein [Thioalkalivibrio paradoxus]|uniref:Heptaprenyl diphosphate synthase n=1 Tax=Thioalkalivibrio paradoxus ARh 1 TaxID=713585 RepID=W0DLR0_9GAMM|nr:Gx transporter family protein [Thioalkalivibrio paradoxus]AHE99539.1 heptaprenyl diphosphate synthase [Thioalkalivibrio paradoxus ARh 1]